MKGLPRFTAEASLSSKRNYSSVGNFSDAPYYTSVEPAQKKLLSVDNIADIIYLTCLKYASDPSVCLRPIA